VTDALKLGADAVSLHVNLGDATEPQMLADLGAVCSDANEWGMPVLSMMYARGPKIQDEYDPEVVKHCARVGVELGADIVKVNYTGDPNSFKEVVDGACGVPVVIAGGPKLDSDRDLVQMVYDSVQAGGSGLSVGRNIFQHASPAKIVAALSKVVHEGWSVDDAMELL
jgi:class I fructose-bisphosphate aldolase